MARRMRGAIAHDHRRGHTCRACHLYSTPEGRRRSEAEFKRRYGQAGGRSRKGYRYIYGATVGKVRREQLARQAARQIRRGQFVARVKVKRRRR